MMKTRFSILFLLISLSVILVISCSKTSEDKLIQGNGPSCDTVNMKYSINVLSVLQANCYGCHSKGNTDGSGGISLDSYASLKQFADNGYLAGNITHAPGFIGMPFGEPKMDNCDINIILDWINRGAQNN